MKSGTVKEDPGVNLARGILEKHQLMLDKPAVGRDLEKAQELLIPLLQDIQEAYGYLPPPVLEWVSKKTGISLSKMYGVITFYSQFYLEPKGKHVIRVCQGTACHVKGSKAIGEAIEDYLGVKDGGTTKDMRFTFESVQCLGTCFLAPVIMIDNDYYGEMTQDKVKKVLAGYSE